MKTRTDERPEKDSEKEGEVTFGGTGHTASVGVLAGVAIAVGVPWVAMSNAQVFNQGALVGLIVVAVVFGAAVSLVSAFFGLVIPHRIHGGWAHPGHLRHLRDFAREAERHGFGRHGRRGRGRWMDGEE